MNFHSLKITQVPSKKKKKKLALPREGAINTINTFVPLLLFLVGKEEDSFRTETNSQERYRKLFHQIIAHTSITFQQPLVSFCCFLHFTKCQAHEDKNRMKGILQIDRIWINSWTLKLAEFKLEKTPYLIVRQWE